MILDLPSIVREMIPDIVGQAATSVACIQCTHTIYLVFKNGTTHPTCVVKVGPAEAMEALYGEMLALHRILPDLTATPLCCKRLNADQALLFQQGLPGMPFFQMGKRIRTKKAWIDLRSRSVAVLDRLHAAVMNEPRYQRTIDPMRQLRKVAQRCRDSQIELSSTVLRFIDLSCERLASLGDIQSHWQHGDFCINNLLFAEQGETIIDFDDFGVMAMPMADHFGLALSVNELASEATRWSSLDDDISVCLHNARQHWPMIEDDHLAGLLLYYLLWSLNGSWALPRRARKNAQLIELISVLSEVPDRLIAGRHLVAS